MEEIISFPVWIISFPVLKIYFEGLKVGEIIPFPVWIISFPVLKIEFELLGSNEKHFVRDVFDQRLGSGRSNSISCLDDSISCF